ncbi:hypothetical protein CPJCM30710_11240 [Clostridium polyendosporum]|uniref:Uncharacterized protein n=1 Tax=Clostridium polyendosporum TaxID=69208 RepID=A0A919VLC3_9CLOT|nr:DUF6514 family protein [Clostridium polyendosporum]GIM28458.1 hypothetical protein CPJCM30710_11240 [Clostridium polyendosporum]
MKIVELLLTRNEIQNEVNYKYFYKLVRNEQRFPIGEDKMKVQTYGIEVERHDISNGNLINTEIEAIASISPQRHRVHNLLKMIYDNGVSPRHLIDILGEYVDTYVIDFDVALARTAN